MIVSSDAPLPIAPATGRPQFGQKCDPRNSGAPHSQRGVWPRVWRSALDFGDARIDPDDLRRPLREQVVAEPAAPVHLDEQSAEITQRVLARLQEGAALTPEQACVGAARGDALGVAWASAKEWGHPGESNEGALRPGL